MLVLGAAAISLGAIGAPGRSVGERVPLVAVVLTPGRERTQVPVSEVLERAARALEPKTGVVVLSAEQVGADPAAFVGCRPAERLSCWLRAAHSDAPGAEATPRARFVLVISILTRAGEPDRMSAQLLDVDAAREAVRGARDADEAEDLIQIRAVHGTTGTALVPGLEQLDHWLEVLVEDTLRPPLLARGQWLPFGAVRLHVDRPLSVELDGRPLGTFEPGEALLVDVRAGRRALLARDPARPDGDPAGLARHEVVVTAGAEAAVLVVMPSTLGGVTRSASLWGGIATAAVGAGLVVWAAAASPSSRAITPCVGAGCEGARPSQWDDACTLTRDDPASCGDARGLRIAPLGGALALAGTSWAVGSTLGDSQDVPWIGWVAGVAAGALAYGIALAAEPR